MEKYPSELRAQLMEDETSVRTQIPCPGAGHIVTLGFPGLAFDVSGSAYVDRERMETTLSAAALRACRILIVLVEKTEVPDVAWTLLHDIAGERDIRIVHMPIPDYEAPDAGFAEQWAVINDDLSDILNAGNTVALSCHYGAGRSGTIAASMLMDRGLSVTDAIEAVRAEFAESIESEKQLIWLQQKEQAA